MMDRLDSAKIEKKEIEALCQLIDNKPNIDDINKVFHEMQSQIDVKQNANEFGEWRKQQKEVNDCLMRCGLSAKYVWKGLVSKSSIVQFEEVFNNLR